MKLKSILMAALCAVGVLGGSAATLTLSTAPINCCGHWTVDGETQSSVEVPDGALLYVWNTSLKDSSIEIYSDSSWTEKLHELKWVNDSSYVWARWSVGSMTTITGNMELSAVISLPAGSYGIDAVADPAEGGTASVTPIVYASNTVSQTATLVANASEGYEFVEWVVKNGPAGVSVSGDTLTIPADAAGDIAVAAKFEALPPPTTHVLTLSTAPDNGYGHWTVDGATQSSVEVPEGAYLFFWNGSQQNADIEIYSDSAWTEKLHSLKWLNDSSYGWTGWSTNSTAIMSDMELSAVVTVPPEEYSISVAVDPAEGGTASAGAAKYAVNEEEGQTVSLEATPAGEYEFVEWVVSGPEGVTASGNTLTIPAGAAGDIEVTAKFQVPVPVTYVLTLATKPADGYGHWTVDGATQSSVEVPENAYLFFWNGSQQNADIEIYSDSMWTEKLHVLKWVNDSSYGWTGWSTNSTAITQDMELAALVNGPEAYDIVATADPAEGGTASVTPVVYASNTVAQTATLVADASEGYEFVEWVVEEGPAGVSVSGDTLTIPANAAGDIAVTAKFGALPPPPPPPPPPPTCMLTLSTKPNDSFGHWEVDGATQAFVEVPEDAYLYFWAPSSATGDIEVFADETGAEKLHELKWVNDSPYEWTGWSTGSTVIAEDMELSAMIRWDPVAYRDWDDVKKVMTNATCTAYDLYDAETTLEAGKTYVVKGNKEVSSPIVVQGTESSPTRLILCDGAKLAAGKGIVVADDKALVICAQSKDAVTMGKLEAVGANGGAGIGAAAGSCGAVTISGGNVTAQGDEFAAGIGGSDRGSCGAVTINGGIVTATGGLGGAGIGGGDDGDGGVVTINGGIVTAKGFDGAGIGNGSATSGTPDAGTVAFVVDFFDVFSVKAGEAADVAASVVQTDYAADHSAKYVHIEAPVGPLCLVKVGDAEKELGEDDPVCVASNFTLIVFGDELSPDDFGGYAKRAKGEAEGEYAINFVCTRMPEGFPGGAFMVLPGTFTILPPSEFPEAMGKVTNAKATKGGFLRPAKNAVWKAKASTGCVFTGWEWIGEGDEPAGFAVKSENERLDPKLTFKVGKDELVRSTDFAADWAWIDEDTIDGVELTPSNLVVETLSRVTASVKGLPKGMKFSAKTLKVSGAPAKDGTFKVTVSVKNASGYSWKGVFQMVVAGGAVTEVIPPAEETVLRKGVAVMLWCDAAMGAVKGTGVYALPKNLKISASAKKDYAFAGWYRDPGFSEPMTEFVGGKDCRTAKQTLVVKGPTELFARFVEKTTKAAPITHLRYAGAGYCGADASEFATNETWYVGVKLPMNACQVAFGSLTLPTVKVSGLPKGVKFDKKALRFTGVPTNAGKYTVKVTVKNACGSTDVLKVPVIVVALPAWAVGTFDGYKVEGGATNGTFTATVGKTGKVSGKTAGGVATSFSAKNFSDVFTLDGTNLIYEVAATVSHKVGKKTVKETEMFYLMEDPLTGLGTIGGGDEAGNGCVGVQRAWNRKTDAASGFTAFPAIQTKPAVTLALDNGLMLKFGANGKVTVAGKMDGVKVSGTTYVLPFAWHSTMTANLFAQVPVYVAPKKTTLPEGFCEVYDVLLTVGADGKFDAVSAPSAMPPDKIIITPVRAR